MNHGVSLFTPFIPHNIISLFTLFCRFTGSSILPACLIIDEADDLFSGTQSEHMLLDIVGAIRPRHPLDDGNAPADVGSTYRGRNSTINTFVAGRGRGIPYPEPRQSCEGREAPLLAIPAIEASPIQLIFCGATLPDGRCNVVGQRIAQR